MGKHVVFLPECHSTNDVASRLAEREKMDGTIVITANQTAGKGQRGNTWIVEPGTNLTFSIILHPTFLSVREQFDLNRVITLGIADYVKTVIDKHDVRIKWPNDILVDRKKICGVLIENTVSNNSITRSIVGIGLNVNQQVFEFSNASSLVTFVTKDFNLNAELERLVGFVESRYLALKSRQPSLRNDYTNNLYWRDELRTFRAEGTTFEGRIIGDNDDGRLVIQTENGTRTFGVKEVEYIR